MLKAYLAIMLGGAAGTGLRMAMSGWLDGRYGYTFPIGTLAVNVSGCFAIGIFAALTGPDGIFLTSPLMRQVVMIGVLGGFTTFSSFGLQTFALMQAGDWTRAGANAALSLVLCVVAVWLGHMTATALHQRG